MTIRIAERRICMLAIAALATMLSACASIPLTTMWKLRSFSAQDLKALNPADIRVVVKAPEQLRFEPNQTTLDVNLTPRETQEKILHEHANLVLLKQGRFVPADVPVAQSGYALYLMKLSPQGLKSFQDFQQRLDPDVEHHYESINFDAKVQFGNDSIADSNHFKLTVWLRLKQEGGYFALLDDVPLTYKKEPADHDAKSASH
jgi:hypothetical protein